MSLLANVALGLGLAMDATAVAGARGLAAKKVRLRDALVVALFFGGSQALMPVLGWALGEAVASRIAGWGHWVTFAVLGGIGAKMLYEALKAGTNDPTENGSADVFGLKVLALLALATSIDALAAGIALAASGANIAEASSVIGAITAALSFAGVYLGHRFGARLGKRLEVIGGLVLVALAVKALLDHFRVA